MGATSDNLALYGYGHQNPATFWDPDGSEALVCTPDNIRGGPTSFFSNLSQGQADLQNLQAANQIATSWAGPIFGVLRALGRIFGASEQNVQVLAEVNFNIASTAAVMPRIAGGASSVTAALRRPVPGGQSAAGGRAIIVTPRGVAVTPEILGLQGTSKLVNDFTGIEGSTVEDIISRVPSDWTMLPQKQGMGVRFVDNQGVERLRLHGPSKAAPAGSNSASGWTARVHAPNNQYYDNLGNLVGPKDNAGHIPIFGNPNVVP